MSTAPWPILVNQHSSLQIIDVSDPALPVLRGEYRTRDDAGAYAVFVSGSLAYLADGGAGLQIFRVGAADPGDNAETAENVGALVPEPGVACTGSIGDGLYGPKDVDLFRFTLPTAGSVTLDVDAHRIGSPLDAWLRLFGASGLEIAGGVDDGSGDPHLSFWLEAGTYYVGVSGHPNVAYDPAQADSGAPSDTGGDYQLTVRAHSSDELIISAGEVRLDSSRTFAKMAITGTGCVKLAAGKSQVLLVGSLQIDGDGVVDLGDNDLVVRATAETRGDVLGQVCAWIKSGRAGGTWSGKGIVSSVGRTGRYTGLAAVVNEKLYGGPILPSLGGEALTTNDIIVKYTYDGDMNLDGVVNADDYFLIDTGFIGGGRRYQDGDLNYDGVINADDYFLIDSAFLGQTGPLAGGESAAATTHAAPEPADAAAVEDAVIVQPARKQEADSLLAGLFSAEPVL